MGKTNTSFSFQQTADKSGFLLDSQGGKEFVDSVWNSTYDFPRLPQIRLTFIKLIKLLFIYAFLFHVAVLQTTLAGTNPWKGQIVYLGLQTCPLIWGKTKPFRSRISGRALPAVKELRHIFAPPLCVHA